MHATLVTVVLALSSQLTLAQPDQTKEMDSVRRRPTPKFSDERPSEAIAEQPSERWSKVAPAVALEPPAQTSDRPSIARTAYEQPIASNNTADRSAARLLQEALSSPANQSEKERPLTLLQALRSAGDRPQQLKIVRSYWLLTVRLAESHWAQSDIELLSSITQPRTPPDQALLAAAVDSATAHELDVQLKTLATQNELTDLARLSSSPSPLRPVDEPLVTSYTTNFDVIFANRAAPGRVVHLAKALPIQQRLVNTRGRSVQSAEVAAHRTIDEYHAGRATISQVLGTVEKLQSEREQFLNALRDYNQSIAEYSLNVVSSSTSTETLVSTLVHTQSSTRTATQRRTNSSRDGQPSGGTARRSDTHEQTRFHQPESTSIIRREPNRGTSHEPSHELSRGPQHTVPADDITESATEDGTNDENTVINHARRAGEASAELRNARDLRRGGEAPADPRGARDTRRESEVPADPRGATDSRNGNPPSRFTLPARRMFSDEPATAETESEDPGEAAADDASETEPTNEQQIESTNNGRFRSGSNTNARESLPASRTGGRILQNVPSASSASSNSNLRGSATRQASSATNRNRATVVADDEENAEPESDEEQPAKHSKFYVPTQYDHKSADETANASSRTLPTSPRGKR